MKITDVEIFVVDGGRRPWLFSAVRTDEGITGYGEFGSGVTAHSLVGLVEDLKPLIIGQDPESVEKLYFDLYRNLRAMPGGIAQMGIAGIELACLGHQGQGARSPGQQPRRRTLPRQPAGVLVPPRERESRRPFARALTGP